MARIGGLTPSGGDMRGCNNLAEIMNSSEALKNLQAFDAFDNTWDASHGPVLTDTSTGYTYRVKVTDGSLGVVRLS